MDSPLEQFDVRALPRLVWASGQVRALPKAVEALPPVGTSGG